MYIGRFENVANISRPEINGTVENRIIEKGCAADLHAVENRFFFATKLCLMGLEIEPDVGKTEVYWTFENRPIEKNGVPNSYTVEISGPEGASIKRQCPAKASTDQQYVVESTLLQPHVLGDLCIHKIKRLVNYRRCDSHPISMRFDAGKHAKEQVL